MLLLLLRPPAFALFDLKDNWAQSLPEDPIETNLPVRSDKSDDCRLCVKLILKHALRLCGGLVSDKTPARFPQKPFCGRTCSGSSLGPTAVHRFLPELPVAPLSTLHSY